MMWIHGAGFEADHRIRVDHGFRSAGRANHPNLNDRRYRDRAHLRLPLNQPSSESSNSADFRKQRIGTSIIVFDPTIIADPDPAMFTAEHWRAKRSLIGHAAGRGSTYFFRHANEEFALRHYRRGGLVGNFLDDRYLFTGFHNSRACRELFLLKAMRQMNLPVPLPVAARVRRTGLCYRADILTGRIPRSLDAHQLLCQGPFSREKWARIGRTIRRFHDGGVFHHDLNIRNIMLDDAGSVWLIDFDKCITRSGESWKRKNLARLRRSLGKERGKHSGFCWSPKDWDALLAGYESSGDPFSLDAGSENSAGSDGRRQ